jgi:hypothetical protein
MTKRPNLPQNHHRVLSSTAHRVEETLDKLETILRSGGVKKLTSTITASYSNEERQRLLHLISKMRRVNEDFVHDFALSKTTSDEARILGASITHLWTILVDSTSKGMRGFGPLAPHLAREVDKHVDRLLAVLDEFYTGDR